jgi:phosphoglycerate dehydrogenase-like enzyme
MKSVIVIHPDVEANWPFAADYALKEWSLQGPTDLYRLEPSDRRPVGKVATDLGEVSRLIAWGVPLTLDCLAAMPKLTEVAIGASYRSSEQDELYQRLDERGIRRYVHPTEGFWAQSVSEFGLALTLCGLRRIPQTHHQIASDLTPWNYGPEDGVGRPGQRGYQYGDDSRFTNGTVQGKRIRIVGAGNIASRYASFVHMLGAEVAAWDPFASEPCFHRAGSRREYHLDRLVLDAEVFVPMVPLTKSTEGIVTASHIESLPEGCLVVMVTRAKICDMAAIRRRVLADEIALAADVFDVEPLPLDDPLLGRHNVVHTPHNAGRTRQANEQWAEALLTQFMPSTNPSGNL